MADLFHSLGPWVWHTEAPGPCWRAPDGALGGVDLRQIADMGPGPTAKGVGFFVTDRALAAPYVALGSDLNAPLPAAALVAWKQALGWTPSPPATPLSALWEALTEQSDGAKGALPLDCTVAGDLEIHLGGHSLVRREKFQATGNHWLQLKKMRQAEYKELRKAALKGKTDKEKQHHRRVMASWVRKYGVDYHDLLGGEPDEAPLPPETTYSDNFNRADGALTTPWLNFSGCVFGVVSNQCKATTPGTSYYRTTAEYQADLSGSDMYAQVDAVDVAALSGPGCGVRETSTPAVQFYGCFIYGTQSLFVRKYISGAATDLAGSPVSGLSFAGLPDTIRLTANGSSISVTQDGTSRYSQTDTSIAGNTRACVHAYTNDSGANRILDNFEAADLAAGGQPFIKRFGGIPFAAVNRGVW